jgi:hypothetical protein
MSALAMYLSAQDHLQNNNLKSMFAVEKMRQRLATVFDLLFQRLQRGKQLAAYKLESGHYLIGLDGSQYFSSKKSIAPVA